MSYTINDALKETTEAAKAAVAGELPQVRKVIKSFTQDRKQRLETLVAELKRGQLNAATLGIALKKEEKALKAELKATRILNKAALHQSVNAAMKTLEKGLLRVAGK